MNQSPEFERPDLAVADQIVARLVNEGFLPQPFADRVAPALASGTLRANDWRRLAEQVLAWEMQEGEHE